MRASKLLLTFLVLVLLMLGCSDDKQKTIAGEVSGEYTLFDGGLIKFTEIPIGVRIESFILEGENTLFEVEPADFERYGGGRAVEIQYLETDVHHFPEIETVAVGGSTSKTEKKRPVYTIISITGDANPNFD